MSRSNGNASPLGHEMGPAFAKHAAILNGVQIKSLQELADFNRENPELSYTKRGFHQEFCIQLQMLTILY